mmetsp:Transcript_63995/g.152599  ORF Transcript_63995/g.152599 Transcript_63995/m.152599 type:complete len:203 (-) Transcript_63995:104-712(-)
MTSAPYADASLPYGSLVGIESDIAARWTAAASLRRPLSAGPRSTERGRAAASQTQEGQATRATSRPVSAAQPRCWRAAPHVYGSFEELANKAPGGRVEALFGPKHKDYREKVLKVIDDDFQKRKEETAREKDGHLRRQAIEAALASYYPKPAKTSRNRESSSRRPSKGPGRRLFSEVPLLETSESAVRWYMTQTELTQRASR